jgi:hypothetical protein
VKKFRWILVLLAIALIAASCGRSDDEKSTADTTGGGGTTATTAAAADAACDKEPLKATDVGITADTITVETLADVGSSLAPGLFQGNHDAMEAFAKYVNAHGGIGCRDLAVKLWDTKLDPGESKNGLIDACKGAVAMVGGNALFNPDVKTLVDCQDKAGAATGLPDIAALANDVNEQCNPTSFMIQAVSEKCPITTGQPRPITALIGSVKYYKETFGDLHGVWLVPGDLPTTVQSATNQIKAQEGLGLKFDATPKVSGRAEQSAYTPYIQTMKAAGSNYLYNGSNDTTMIKVRKEAKAQGLTGVKVWACSLACYTRNMLSVGGADVEGTYVWMQFLPFEEADSNPELAAYVEAIGADKVDSFGAQAWQAGAVFKTVIDKIVAEQGPNAITRASILKELNTTKEYDANGWMGKKDLKGISTCMVIMQVKNSKFVRVHPAKKGTFDCDPGNAVTVTLDPAAEAAKIK